MQECKGTNVFSNLKIGVRLAVGFAVLIAMMLAVGVTALVRLNTINEDVEDIIHDHTPKVAMANQMIADVNAAGIAIRNAMLIVIAGIPGAFIHILFTSSLLIEVIFSLDGLGLLGFDGALRTENTIYEP